MPKTLLKAILSLTCLNEKLGRVLIIFLFLFSLQGFAQTQNLPTTVIVAEDPETESPRASLWPAQTEIFNESTALPQFEETLNSIGGIQSRFDGSPTISMRGSGQSGRVLTLYNDIPLNFATGFGPPEILFPKEIIGKVVVVKGPSSLFYGSQAMSGSVNFLPEKVKKTQLRFGISDTDNSYLPWTEGRLSQHNVTFISPLWSKEKSFSQFSLFNDYDDGEFPFQSKDVSGTRDHSKKKTQRATLWGTEKFRTIDLHYNLIWGNLDKESPGAINFPLPTEEKTQGYLVSLSPTIKLSDSLRTKVRTHFIKVESDFIDPAQVTKLDQQTSLLQSELNWTPLSQLNIQLFNDYFHHQIDSS